MIPGPDASELAWRLACGMDRTLRLFAIAALLTGSLGALAACSGTGSGHSSITYQAWADGGDIAEVASYEFDGVNGGVMITEIVDDTRWESSVDGGSVPEITVTPDGAGTIANCKIVDEKTGETLDEQTGTASEPVVCRADLSKTAE